MRIIKIRASTTRRCKPLEYPTTTPTMFRMTAGLGADVRLEDEASAVLFQPLTPAAHAWFKTNVPTEEWQWVGGRLAVERRYADNLIDGLIAAGLTVAGKHAKQPPPAS